MCIIFTHNTFYASKTVLVLTPLATPSNIPQAWQLIYINDINLRPSSFPAPNPRPIEAQPLMIVPIPNFHDMSEHQFTLFSISSEQASDIRDAAHALISPYEPPTNTSFSVNSTSSFGASPNQFAPSPLLVQDIGNYKISVAPSFDDLKNRAPWKRFSVTSNQVNEILTDMTIRYKKKKMAFIIAELRQFPNTLSFKSGDHFLPENSFGTNSSGTAGFGVRYRDSRSLGGFFPISHEPPSLRTDSVIMDVTLVALGAIIKPLSLLSHAKSWPLRLKKAPDTQERIDDGNVVIRAADEFSKCVTKRWHGVHQLHSWLPRYGEGLLHNNIFVEPEWPSVATVWSLKGSYPNRDVLARKETVTDTALCRRLLSDFDSWHRIRIKQMSRLSNNALDHAYICRRLDFVLALLGRQLAEPGVVDRVSDVQLDGGEKADCGSVAYVNLDKENCDLDEASYQEKNSRNRHLLLTNGEAVDTAGNCYLRIAAHEGAYENIAMRTVTAVVKPTDGKVKPTTER